MQRISTPKRVVRIAATIDADIAEQMDRERKGRYSRAAVVRMALADRYQKDQRAGKQVA